MHALARAFSALTPVVVLCAIFCAGKAQGDGAPLMPLEEIADIVDQFVLIEVPKPSGDGAAVPTQEFYIGRTEVTQALYHKVTGFNPSYSPCETCPVNNVSGYNIDAFIRKLNRATGLQFYLPTRREWDYAAKGGKYSRGYLYSGSNDLGEVAWYSENSGGKIHPVAQKKPNELGLNDMTGNVSELCSDVMAGSKGSNSLFALRGGSYDYAESESALSNIDGISKNLRLPDVGFRLALKKDK